MAEESDGPQEVSEGKPKKSKLLLFIIIGVAVALLAGGGFFAFTTFFASQPAIENDDMGLEKTAPKNKAVIGEMLAMSPFVVNLADPKGKRYLKVTIEVEFEELDAIERAQKAKPKLRDMVIMMLTSLSFEDVMTPEGKVRIRDELLERFNHTLKPDRIRNIYFTEFVVQ